MVLKHFLKCVKTRPSGRFPESQRQKYPKRQVTLYSAKGRIGADKRRYGEEKSDQRKD